MKFTRSAAVIGAAVALAGAAAGCGSSGTSSPASSAAPAKLVKLADKICNLRDVAQTAPLLDLWQGAQDRLYSRLFQT